MRRRSFLRGLLACALPAALLPGETIPTVHMDTTTSTLGTTVKQLSMADIEALMEGFRRQWAGRHPDVEVLRLRRNADGLWTLVDRQPGHWFIASIRELPDGTALMAGLRSDVLNVVGGFRTRTHETIDQVLAQARSALSGARRV